MLIHPKLYCFKNKHHLWCFNHPDAKISLESLRCCTWQPNIWKWALNNTFKRHKHKVRLKIQNKRWQPQGHRSSLQWKSVWKNLWNQIDIPTVQRSVCVINTLGKTGAQRPYNHFHTRRKQSIYQLIIEIPYGADWWGITLEDLTAFERQPWQTVFYFWSPWHQYRTDYWKSLSELHT